MVRLAPEGRLSLREEQKQVTRRRILDAAKEIFQRDGFSAMSIEAIAAAAGVSRPTFYQYFPNKTAVLAQLVADRAERTGMLFVGRLARNTRPTLEDLRAWIDEFVDLYDANLATMVSWAHAESGDPASLEAIVDVQGRLVDTIAEYISAVRIESGIEADSEAIRIRAMLLYTQLDRFCYLWRARGWACDRTQATVALAESWLYVLYDGAGGALAREVAAPRRASKRSQG